MIKNVVAAAVAVAFAHAGAWYLAHDVFFPPDLSGRIASMSFNIGTPEDNGRTVDAETLARIEQDLAVVAGVARSIRLYSARGIFETVTARARDHDLNVTVGAWLSRDENENRKELDAAVRLANRNPHVRALVIGNEAVLREDMSVEQLISHLRHAQKRSKVPVSTGETWHTWIENPQLANEVDFIAAHVLPYWEGAAPETAVAFAFDRYDDLRRVFPGKRIVLAEFGWPSRGYNNQSAHPDPMTQARIVREFAAEAERRGIEYNVVEAFDQPWKVGEGSVGPYWGIFDDARRPKFRLSGQIESTGLPRTAGLALAIGFAATLCLAFRRPTLAHALAFSTAANALAATIALAALYPIDNYLNPGSAIAWGIGFLLMFPLSAMTLVKIHEVAEITLGRRPRRLLPAHPAPAPGPLPMVSIHIPAYREPPEMLMRTLDAVARLGYPAFEALVIVNNTPEEHYWKPVEEHCRRLGERFKFVFLPKVAGFKAGALNEAMAWVDPRAEIYALLDADYVVDPDWLRDLVPAFADPAVGMVQAPQDHRDGNESLLKSVMNSEYAGFFDIGMVQRNEDDAIILHGTMLMLRRSAFEAVGGWSTDTITEDTELGLRLFEAGYRAHYTRRRYGWGVLPNTYKAFKVQRHRWAYGAVQIIRRHWRHMLPGSPSLGPAQKFQYVTGWIYWLSDAFGVAAALLNLLWVPVILFVGVLLPMLPFTLPILAAFFVNLLHCAVLYGTRVKLPPGRIAGAAVAAMSLQYTVAGAMMSGFIKDNLPFRRTDKGGNAKRRPNDDPARQETVIGTLLVLGAGALVAANQAMVVEVYVFAATLLIQSLPFLAASGMALLERIEGARGKAGDGTLVPVPAT